MKPIDKLARYLLAFSLTFLLGACGKKDITLPAATTPSSPVSYSDANISIANFEAQQLSPDSIQVSFSTLYQNNIAKVEVLSGSTQNQLCSVFVQNQNGTTIKGKNYAFTDTDIKGKTMYYMIKYTMNNSNWGYTPLFELTLK